MKNLLLCPESATVTDLFALWSQTNTGSMDDFWEFVVNPSASREIFFSSLTVSSMAVYNEVYASPVVTV